MLYQGGGIGDYNLLSPADRVFAFDYNSSGGLTIWCCIGLARVRSTS